MNLAVKENYIVIAPQIYVPLEPQDSPDLLQETRPRTTEIPMLWIQDGSDFRLDINLPKASVLDLYFSTQVGSLHINGETIWENSAPHAVGMAGAHAEMTPNGLRLTCTSCGTLHILARCILAANN